ncbi:MAG: hypothetical protein AAF743_17435, partial [Planctomycetota bacterium]
MVRSLLLAVVLFCTLGAVRVQVFVMDGDRPTPVVGEVVSSDDTSVTLATNTGEKSFAWSALTPASAFTARMRIEPPTTAEQWLELGEFGWLLGAEQQARTAFGRATKMDGSLASAVDAITSEPAGSARLPMTTDTPTPDGFGKPEPEPETPEPTATTVPPELAAAWAKAVAEDVEKLRTEIGWQAGTFETEHCLVFTDWPADEHAFMAHNLEAAYAAVCQLFEIPLDADVMVGKLPVFMFNDREMYNTWVRRQGLDGRFLQSAGLFWGYSDGRGMLVMWKPDYPRDSRGGATKQAIKRAEDRWAAVLAHEFTHGFIHRYRSNRFIPSWLNEGTAETVRHALFPSDYSYQRAREAAASGRSIQHMFVKGAPTQFEDYPIAHTIVEMLIREDPQRFRNVIHRIKAGEEMEAVLKAEYG